MSMRDEIRFQPQMIREISESWVEDVDRLRLLLTSPTAALVAARGTSDNAARYAKYLWGVQNRLPVALAAPSLYTGYQTEPVIPSDWAVVGISQSGASPDLRAVLGADSHRLNDRIAITNDGSSPLAAVASVVVALGAGEEYAVAATKTYTAQLAAAMKLSEAWSGEVVGISGLATAMEHILDDEASIQKAAERVADMASCAILGRGLNMATAYEWALKITETSYVSAHPFSSADFRHGPIAMAGSATPVLAVIDNDAFASTTMTLVEALRAERGTPTVLISSMAEAKADVVIRIPELRRPLTPLVAAVAVQLFSYHLAIARGLDPDSPKGLTKITSTL
jgi:glucosamine--fructose-6-phosphate aminotransferase (isomerizing)